jgi:hypothetical protein
MSNVLSQHTCNRIEPSAELAALDADKEGVDFEVMTRYCDAFCGPDAVAILVGTEGTGFPLNEVDQICTGSNTNESVLEYNPELMSNCRDWSRSLDQINVKAADFIASVRNMTFEQLYYRAAMEDKINALEAQMTSDATREEVDLASSREKLGLLQDILSANLQDLMGDGLLQMDLRAKLEDLSRKSRTLSTVIETNLDNLDSFVNQCNVLLLATGPLNEYLLDICSVTSRNCIDSEEGGEADGEHAACCCGVVPSIGIFSIPGVKDASGGGRRLDSHRRLEGHILGADEQMDICGAAYQASVSAWNDANQRMAEFDGGPAVVNEYLQSQERAYPEFYGDCDNRRLEAVDTTSSDGSSDGEVFVEMEDDRNLQSGPNFLSCPIPTHAHESTERLRVSFWQQTEATVCAELSFPGSDLTVDENLAAICSEFCAPTSVPFLLGTSAFGFSQEQLDAVCLRPEGVTGNEYTNGTVNECHRKANSFADLQNKAATFAAKLQVLDASKIRFESAARRASEALKREIAQRAEDVITRAGNAPGRKIAALMGLIRTGLEDIVGSESAVLPLRRDAQAVREAAGELRTTLETVIPQLLSFLEECNILTTGTGPDSEYLLDLCSVTGTDCIDTEHGQHAACCCGYNPVTTLGSANVAPGRPTISGNSAVTGGTTGRRLQASNAVDICAEAEQISRAEVLDHRRETSDALAQRQDCERRARYPAFYEQRGCDDVDPTICSQVGMRQFEQAEGFGVVQQRLDADGNLVVDNAGGGGEGSDTTSGAVQTSLALAAIISMIGIF